MRYVRRMRYEDGEVTVSFTPAERITRLDAIQKFFQALKTETQNAPIELRDAVYNIAETIERRVRDGELDLAVYRLQAWATEVQIPQELLPQLAMAFAIIQGAEMQDDLWAPGTVDESELP